MSRWGQSLRNSRASSGHAGSWPNPRGLFSAGWDSSGGHLLFLQAWLPQVVSGGHIPASLHFSTWRVFPFSVSQQIQKVEERSTELNSFSEAVSGANSKSRVSRTLWRIWNSECSVLWVELYIPLNNTDACIPKLDLVYTNMSKIILKCEAQWG